MATKHKKSKKKKGVQEQSKWKAKKPVIRFALGFILLILVLFAISSSDFFDALKQPLLAFYSSVGAVILNLFGYGVKANGELLSSAQFSVSIEEGCDAIAPAILFAASIAAFPTDWKYKLKGIVFGLFAIFILNIIRVVSLFITGVHAASLFEIMHVEVWQTLFIIFTLGMWLYWLKWSTQQKVDVQG